MPLYSVSGFGVRVYFGVWFRVWVDGVGVGLEALGFHFDSVSGSISGLEAYISTPYTYRDCFRACYRRATIKSP